MVYTDSGCCALESVIAGFTAEGVRRILTYVHTCIYIYIYIYDALHQLYD